MGFTKNLLTTTVVVGGAVGALAAYNAVTQSMAGELDTVLRGEERRYPWKYGDMFYEVKGSRDSKPLLLVHGFGPGASSYEWRKNVDTLSEQYRVYVIDLLGFGLSDRPAIDYTAETFTDLIGDFIKEVINKPTTVVAHGLSSAYVIATAFRKPQLFERLVLVSPPQAILQESLPGPLNTVWKSILRTPILGEFIYNVLTSRQAIRAYYDNQGFYSPALITDELVEYVYTSAHQSNSRYVAASFISDYLSLDVHEALSRLQMPVVAIWGSEATTPSESVAAFKRVNSRIETRTIDKASAQLQDEQAAQFNNVLREFAATSVK